jgi:hypothetical protein
VFAVLLEELQCGTVELAAAGLMIAGTISW